MPSAAADGIPLNLLVRSLIIEVLVHHGKVWVDWSAIQRIYQYFLEEHSVKPELENIETLCIDEVSYKKRHHYFTIISDYVNGQIIEIIEGRAYQNVAKVLRRINADFAKRLMGKCGYMGTVS